MVPNGLRYKGSALAEGEIEEEAEGELTQQKQKTAEILADVIRSKQPFDANCCTRYLVQRQLRMRQRVPGAAPSVTQASSERHNKAAITAAAERARRKTLKGSTFNEKRKNAK